MGATVELLERGRAAYESRAWAEASAALAQADAADGLAADELELLATSLFMVGRMDDFLAVLERAHDTWLERGEGLRAARAAFFLGVNLILRGELGRGSGWFGRANRLVEREGRECVESGYLLMPVAFRHEAGGDYDAAFAAAASAAEVGERFDDPDLFSLAVHTQGLARIR